MLSINYVHVTLPAMQKKKKEEKENQLKCDNTKRGKERAESYKNRMGG